MESVTIMGSANYGDITYSIDLSYYQVQITSILATCPFSGTIVDPVSILGPGVSAYLSGNGGFQPLAGTVSVSVDTKSYIFTFDTGSNTISQTRRHLRQRRVDQKRRRQLNALGVQHLLR